MKRWLIDTSVLIDHLRGREAAARLLLDATRNGDELWSSTVVRTEILAGMRPTEEHATMRLFDALRWLSVSADIADRAGALARQYLRSHPGVDTVDHILAATAQALGAQLVTVNVKHFPMFPGLHAPYR